MLLVLGSLTGCAELRWGEDAPWLSWQCQGGVELQWRALDRERQQIELRLGENGEVHHLQRAPSTFGRFYSDGQLGFHDKGNAGLVYRESDGQPLAQDCKGSLVNL